MTFYYNYYYFFFIITYFTYYIGGTLCFSFIFVHLKKSSKTLNIMINIMNAAN